MKKMILLVFVTLNLFALTQKEYIEQEKSAFNSFKKSQEDGFKSYKKAQNAAFAKYKKGISEIWQEPKMSTKKKWVSYSEDKKTRSDVDFEAETITVETIASSPQEAQMKLKVALAKAVTIDTKTVQKTDPLEKILAKIKKPKGIVDAKVKAEPILATVIFKKPPTRKSVAAYVNKHINKKKIVVQPAQKIKHSKLYTIKVKMPKNAMIKRSKIYYSEIKKHSLKQKIPMALTFAIMHSESNFNPRARSHIPAYGLMQLVPKTAGIDTYRYLYKKKRLVTGQYLYNSTNNITMGTAYLHILYYRYLRKIKNPDSRMYCTIAAYNTGAGNIAYAFTKKYNMNKAAPLINKLTPDEVYAKLMKDLRWDEPKHYLKKVSKRMSAYHKLYKM